MEFRLLGPLEVRSGDEALPLGGAKQRALLAILLLQANHVVSRERLSELLWNDDPPPTADHVIEVYVSQLRRVLEPDGAPYKVLIRKPVGYVLEVDPSDIDTTRFARLVESARSSPPAEAAAQLATALEMWRGPALADFAGERFAFSEAARLDELRLFATEERIDAELKLGRHARLIGELQGLVEQHPLRERLCGQLMLALYRSGRQAEASDVYQKTRERLVDELGMEPGPELQGLLKRILQQESGLAAAAEVAAPPLPSGTVTFLLTDLEGSTRLWEHTPTAMHQALAIHDAVMGRAMSARGGLQVESGREGDSILAVFPRAADAIACAVEIQREFAAQSWPEGGHLHIRVAVHTGEAELRGGHYFGPAVYRCARLLASGHGDQVLVSQATHDVVVDTLPGGVALRDLGQHRLRDLERPERIFQLTAPGLRAEFPPLKSMDPLRHNLPISPTRFIGREAELAEIAKLLVGHRMLSLVGSGGTGKTRLALQAAAENIERFPDGVWCVELASVREPELVAQTVAEALGVREEADRPVIKTLVDRLRDRKFLLVIDNCEHLIPAAVKLADELMRACDGMRLLATSREALRVSGEGIMRVGPLAEPDAVTLFVERSNAVESSFQVTPENSELVRQICRRVESIPLAIELAAGRSQMMSPAEILARLQESFSLLAGGSRSAEGRHETLNTAIDWSYWLLGDSEQRLLRSLAVFSGGFTLEAADAVFGQHSLALLSQLIEKSLIAAQQTANESTRYRLLETVREYGLSRLRDHGELEDMQARHGEFFATMVEASRNKLKGPDRTKWLGRLGDDVDNLRAVFDTGELSPSASLDMAATLANFWEARGEYREARSRLKTALAKSTGPTTTRIEGLEAAGMVAWLQGDLDAAVDYTSEGLRLSRNLRESLHEARLLHQLSQIATLRGDFESARAYVEEALGIATAHGDEEIQAMCEWRLGFIALFTNDLDAATSHYQTSIRVLERLRDVESVASSKAMLGFIALRQNRLADARSYLVQSLEMQRRHGSSRQVANLLEMFAALAVEEDQVEQALRLGGAAAGIRNRLAIVAESPLSRDIMPRLEKLRPGSSADNAWLSGWEMSREDAIAYALSEGDLRVTVTSKQSRPFLP